MQETETNFYYIRDSKFKTTEICTMSTAIVISIIDMCNRTLKEDYVPRLGDLIVESIYQDNISKSRINVYKIEVIHLLPDGSKVLQIKPGANKNLYDDNDVMIILSMLKTKAIALFSKIKTETYGKTTQAYDRLPEEDATTEVDCCLHKNKIVTIDKDFKPILGLVDVNF